jgi:CheY-like chemotaxis protein
MLSSSLQARRSHTNIYPMSEQPNNLKPLVLIVENDEDTRYMLKTILEIWGYSVAESENGEDSIGMALNNCPNVILMDISLSKTDDGLTTMRRMRQIDTLRRVPIVFVSGHAQPEFRAFALNAGGDDFLVKPVDFNQLETILRKFTVKNTADVTSGGFAI